MKTLILNGSPKRNGDTAALIGEFTKHLNGEMQSVYPYLEACDNLVIASPIWFSELSGPLLNLASRIQTYFIARVFRHEPIPIKPKNGVLLLVGGKPGTQLKAISTAHTIFRNLNALPCIASVFSINTNEIPSASDLSALEGARDTAFLLNRLYPVKI